MSRVAQITTTDGYQTIPCPQTVRVTFQVSNASILIGFGRGLGAAVYALDEQYLPVVASVARICDEIRIRSAVPGNPAVVYLTALTADDG